MKSFTLEIKSPEKILFVGRANSLRANALDGELGIMRGHAPLATVLTAGEVIVKDENNEEKKFAIQSGFLIARADQVTIFSER